MSNVLCGILLVLHVNIISSVCYIMVINFLLFSCCRQQKDDERKNKGGEDLPEPPSKLFISCQSLFCYVHVVLCCD